MATFFSITSDSSPLYDSFGSANFWSCEDWMKWRQELGKKYTPTEADYLWSKAWLDGVSVISGGNGEAPGSNYVLDSSPLDCRTFNTVFKDFLEANPNLRSAVYSGVGGLIAKPIGLGVDVVKGVVEIASNVVSGATGASKYLKWIIPILLIVVVGGAIIYFGKKAKVF